MCNRYAPSFRFKLDGKPIEITESFNYLGHNLHINGNLEVEIKRIQLTWTAFGKLNYIFKSNIPLSLKKKVFDQYILPVLTYGSETWTLSKKMINRIQATQRRMERSMMGINLLDKKEIHG